MKRHVLTGETAFGEYRAYKEPRIVTAIVKRSPPQPSRTLTDEDGNEVPQDSPIWDFINPPKAWMTNSSEELMTMYTAAKEDRGNHNKHLFDNLAIQDAGDEPEKVSHVLVAGLLLWLAGTHEIKSNRESGYGRYDIMLIPRDNKGIGYVIEFKTVDTDENESVPAAVEAALKQIDEKKYETELSERGIDGTNIKKLAVVFRGKTLPLKKPLPQNKQSAFQKKTPYGRSRSTFGVLKIIFDFFPDLYYHITIRFGPESFREVEIKWWGTTFHSRVNQD